ncbi:PorV/PorQ family protein [candidate division KSB1 bacterium]|nr:PorV/PorQ family protein [candidate division KSB1 bacterium]
MKKQLMTCMISLLLLPSFCGILAADKKLAQTGFQFLSIPPHARSAAMGEAFTTIDGRSSSLFYNPANMARMDCFMDFSFTKQNWIADINLISASFAVNPARGAYGTLGFSLMTVDYGEIQGTRVDAGSDAGYIDTETYSPGAFVVGTGYGIALTDRFSVGGQIKYAYQSIGSNTIPILDKNDQMVDTETKDNELGVVAYDFGTLYQTGFRSIAFGMSVSNFSPEVKYENESFQLPMTFRIGISMDVLDFLRVDDSIHSLLVSIDALHPRAYSERLNFGIEYLFMDLFALRGGYLYNYDERGLTAGLGVQKNLNNRLIAFDYAYTPFGIFDNVQQLSFRVSL